MPYQNFRKEAWEVKIVKLIGKRIFFDVSHVCCSCVVRSFIISGESLLCQVNTTLLSYYKMSVQKYILSFMLYSNKCCL